MIINCWYAKDIVRHDISYVPTLAADLQPVHYETFVTSTQEVMFSVQFNCWSDLRKLGGMLVQQRVPTSEEWAIASLQPVVTISFKTCKIKDLFLHEFSFKCYQNQHRWSRSSVLNGIQIGSIHAYDKHLNACGSIKERILFKLVLIRNHLFIFYSPAKTRRCCCSNNILSEGMWLFLALLCKYESVTWSGQPLLLYFLSRLKICRLSMRINSTIWFWYTMLTAIFPASSSGHISVGPNTMPMPWVDIRFFLENARTLKTEGTKTEC